MNVKDWSDGPIPVDDIESPLSLLDHLRGLVRVLHRALPQEVGSANVSGKCVYFLRYIGKLVFWEWYSVNPDFFNGISGKHAFSNGIL